MPIFDFVCQACSTAFEALIRGSAVAKCPKCGSDKLERLLSRPNMKTSGTTALAMAAARRRDKKQGEERIYTQREYEKSHDAD